MSTKTATATQTKKFQTAAGVKMPSEKVAMDKANGAFMMGMRSIGDAVRSVADDVADNYDTCNELKKTIAHQKKTISEMQKTIADWQRRTKALEDAHENLQKMVLDEFERRDHAEDEAEAEADGKHKRKRKRNAWW